MRWRLLREVPRAGDTDFTVERLAGRANDELANGFGNLVNRVVTMIHRYRDGHIVSAGPAPGAESLGTTVRRADGEIAAGLAGYDFRRATEAVWRIAVEANRYIERVRPWELAKAERSAGDSRDLDAVLGILLHACATIGDRLAPFLPDAAALITRQCTPRPDGRLPAPSPVLSRIVA